MKTNTKITVFEKKDIANMTFSDIEAVINRVAEQNIVIETLTEHQMDITKKYNELLEDNKIIKDKLKFYGINFY